MCSRAFIVCMQIGYINQLSIYKYRVDIKPININIINYKPLDIRQHLCNDVHLETKRNQLHIHT